MPAAVRTRTRVLTPAGERTQAAAFGQRPGFCQLFWLFLITSFLGCLVETLFMLLTRGELQNRSGVLYGSFSLVWGLGAVLFTVCLRRMQGRPGPLIFLAGAVAGAGYEYACSWVQEVLFGSCFWDYSHLPLSLNGRVNLVFSAFWGIAAVVWVRWLYPALLRLISKIPADMGRPLTALVAVIMAFNVLTTSAALMRMDARQREIPAANAVEVFLDRHFTDRRLLATFSTLTYVGTPDARSAAGLGQAVDIPGR